MATFEPWEYDAPEKKRLQPQRRLASKTGGIQPSLCSSSLTCAEARLSKANLPPKPIGLGAPKPSGAVSASFWVPLGENPAHDFESVIPLWGRHVPSLHALKLVHMKQRDRVCAYAASPNQVIKFNAYPNMDVSPSRRPENAK